MADPLNIDRFRDPPRAVHQVQFRKTELPTDLNSLPEWLARLIGEFKDQLIAVQKELLCTDIITLDKKIEALRQEVHDLEERISALRRELREATRTGTNSEPSDDGRATR